MDLAPQKGSSDDDKNVVGGEKMRVFLFLFFCLVVYRLLNGKE